MSGVKQLCAWPECREVALPGRKVCADAWHSLLVARRNAGLDSQLPPPIVGRGFWLFVERTKRGISRREIARRLNVQCVSRFDFDHVHPTAIFAWEVSDQPIDPRHRPALCFLEVAPEMPTTPSPPIKEEPMAEASEGQAKMVIKVQLELFEDDKPGWLRFEGMDGPLQKEVRLRLNTSYTKIRPLNNVAQQLVDFLLAKDSPEP